MIRSVAEELRCVLNPEIKCSWNDMHAGRRQLTLSSTYHRQCSAAPGTIYCPLVAQASSSRQAWLAHDHRLCDAVLVLVPVKGMTAAEFLAACSDPSAPHRCMAVALGIASPSVLLQGSNA
jgi:hypothetical protein